MHFRKKHRRERRRDRRKEMPEIDFGPGEWEDTPPEHWPQPKDEDPYLPHPADRYVNTSPITRALLG